MQYMQQRKATKQQSQMGTLGVNLEPWQNQAVHG